MKCNSFGPERLGTWAVSLQSKHVKPPCDIGEQKKGLQRTKRQEEPQ